MSKMLVAYASCGCRISALLVRDPVEDDIFRLEASQDGFSVREEEHESIGAHRCSKHWKAFDFADDPLLKDGPPLSEER